MSRTRSRRARRRRPAVQPSSGASSRPTPTRLVAFNKPYGVLSQFTDADGRATLADYIDIPGIYAAGRLDRDSEGLLLLTNNGRLNARITQPGAHKSKTYWVQVDGAPDDDALAALADGPTLKDGPTRPVDVVRLEQPALWPRDPPVRYRRHVPTTWLAITLTEGRNRQVRRMTAAIGAPTLRLVRVAIGDWQLADLAPGTWRDV